MDHHCVKPRETIQSPGTPSVRRAIAWPAVFVLSLGSALLVTVSLGPMAGEIGAASVVVWILTAFVGLVQCLLIGELASRHSHKVGGVPAYSHEGLKHLSPLFGAASAWAYWVGWIPGVAVNLTLAATYVKAAFWTDANIVALTAALIVLVYAVTFMGLRFSVWISAAIGFLALPPVVMILAVPLFYRGVWEGGNFSPLLPHGDAWYSPPILLLLAKWMFVAVWSSYGGEMVATILGELRNPDTDIPKAMGIAATVTFLAFAVVPTVLVATVGAEELAKDPYVVFLTASREIFGGLGAAIVSLMLIAALILGAQLFIISSSRALYQMSKDDLTIQSFGRLNRYGVPIGSVGLDAMITLSLLAIFEDNVVNIAAAANVGYILVFILLPSAYVSSRTTGRQSCGGVNRPGFMMWIARFLLLFNATLFIVGGLQWGPKVIGIGLLLVLTGMPFYVYRRRQLVRY